MRQKLRSRPVLAGALVAVGVLVGSTFGGVVGVAVASHQFSDVPTSHPFHDDIDWMADNGITNGYGDGTFRPGAPVTRQAFSAFLRRYNAEIELVQRDVDPGSGTIWSSTATCPAGKRAIGGGGEMPGGDYMLRLSRPLGASWNIGFESEGNVTRDPTHFRVYALCAPVG